MNPSESTPTFTHPIESTGKDETFSKLTLDDVFCQLLPAEGKRRKMELLANLKLAEATREEIAAELQAHDEEWNDADLSDFVRKICDIPRQRLTLIKYCYDKAHPDAAGKLELTSTEVFELIEKIVAPFGLRWKTVEEQKPEEPLSGTPKAPDGPQPLQGYGSEGSGSANPTPSPLTYGK